MALRFLCSEIGRGHPFYLGGLIAEVSARTSHSFRSTSVFQVSRGLALGAWRAARAAYLLAGRSSAFLAVYGALRGARSNDPTSLPVRLLGRDLRRWAASDTGVVVVDHPLLAAALQPRENVFYMHGEIAAPPSAVISQATRVYVPLESTANEFERRGMARSRICITGLCVETELIRYARKLACKRRGRFAGEGPLCVAVFSSGAEPARHAEALASSSLALARRGHKVVAYFSEGGRLQRRMPAHENIAAQQFRTWVDLDRLTRDRFQDFDLVVAPPHERSAWALGLGLPFVLVGPDVGPFAPLNRRALRAAGVAIEHPGSACLASIVDRLRQNGDLTRMSIAGEGPPIDGFAQAARDLASRGSEFGLSGRD